jgi:hypothetical protein
MFDTYRNEGEPSDNFIRVVFQGGGSIPQGVSLPNFSDGNIHTVRIDYVSESGILKIYVDSFPVINVGAGINLLNLDNGRAWVGFTAATGGDAQIHDILNWTRPVQ